MSRPQEIFRAGKGGLPPLEPELAGEFPVWLAGPPGIIDGEPGLTHWLEFVVWYAGAVATVAGALVILWRILAPHAAAWVRRQLAQSVAPVHHQLAEVRQQVVSPDGDTQSKLDDLRHQLGRVHRRMDKQEGLAAITQSVLEQHVQESSAYLDKATRMLAEQGVELPHPDDN